MKLVISVVHDKFQFYQFFRQQLPTLSLTKIRTYATTLPTILESSRFSDADLTEMAYGLQTFADVELQEEPNDNQDTCNANIEPTKEYLAALAWFDTLGELEKAHVEQIIAWRIRPAVC